MHDLPDELTPELTPEDEAAYAAVTDGWVEDEDARRNRVELRWLERQVDRRIEDRREEEARLARPLRHRPPACARPVRSRPRARQLRRRACSARSRSPGRQDDPEEPDHRVARRPQGAAR
jgi:hypothetical protein